MSFTFNFLTVYLTDFLFSIFHWLFKFYLIYPIYKYCHLVTYLWQFCFLIIKVPNIDNVKITCPAHLQFQYFEYFGLLYLELKVIWAIISFPKFHEMLHCFTNHYDIWQTEVTQYVM